MATPQQRWWLLLLAGTLVSQTQACDCGGTNNGNVGKVDFCGDGIRGGTEVCDSDELPDEACSGGRFICTSDCKAYESTCGGGSTCGNGVIETGESCDQSSLGPASCASLGLPAGILACSDTCS